MPEDRAPIVSEQLTLKIDVEALRRFGAWWEARIARPTEPDRDANDRIDAA